MDNVIRASYYRSGPAEIESVISEIIEMRNAVKPFNVAIGVDRIVFTTGDDKTSLVAFAGAQQVPLHFSDSGVKSLCSLMHIPPHVIKRLGAGTQVDVFNDLLLDRFKEEPKTYLNLVCARTEDLAYVRAVFIYGQKVFEDSGVFPVLPKAVGNFAVSDYWLDDFVSVVRFMSPNKLASSDGRDIRIGFDIVNSEVREKSLEIRGVVWLGDNSMILPKFVYPSFRGAHNRIYDIRSLESTVAEFADSIVAGKFDKLVKGALDSSKEVKVSVGSTLLMFLERDIVSAGDVAALLNAYRDKLLMRNGVGGRSVFDVCGSLKKFMMRRTECIEMLCDFARTYDVYFKRASLEFGINLLF